jgi:hypothetical protein
VSSAWVQGQGGWNCGRRVKEGEISREKADSVCDPDSLCDPEYNPPSLSFSSYPVKWKGVG